MSSSSSSECECDPYWESYDAGYHSSYRHAYGVNPYYPTMGHPCVYYAQAPPAPPRNLTHRGRDRERGSPNCFVKAFRWYTKEHVPNRSESPIKPDMTGFAAWLDVKYDQFLQDNQLGSELYHVKLRQTIEAERVPNNSTCEPCAATKFHMKSPWKKRRRAKSNETGESRQKSNQSCHYIMQPKDVSRAPSVCCHPSIGTTGSEYGKKTMVKSQSFSNMILIIKGNDPSNATPACDVGDTKPKVNICNSCKNVDKQSVEKCKASTNQKVVKSQDFGCQFDTEVATKVNVETQYDVAATETKEGTSLSQNQTDQSVCECPGLARHVTPNKADNDSTVYPPKMVYQTDYSCVQCSCKSLDTMPRRPRSRVPANSSTHSQKIPKTKSYKNMECQCPEEKVVNVNAQTQYTARPTTYFDNNICECDFKGFMQEHQTSMQNVPVPSNQVSLCACERQSQEELVTAPFAQTTAQTSNQSICLEKETIHEYPLFLKIVCADKLSEENEK